MSLRKLSPLGSHIHLPARSSFSTIQRRTISTTLRSLADSPSPVGQKISEVAKEEGGPSKGSMAAQMQSQVTKQRNRDATTEAASTSPADGTPVSSEEQSKLDREANFVDAADKVGVKMRTDPGAVTKEDGDTLHSRETKAFGTTEKGGIASQAQSLASQNEKK